MNDKKNKQRVKRRVLLLLGVYSPVNHQGIARYAQQAGWALDNSYARGGLVPTWWQGDGMITLITHPKDYAALRQLPKVPLVDLSKGWITNAMPPPMRRSGMGRPRVLYDNVAIGRLAAEHFLERGFQHMALVNRGNWWMEVERIPTFRDTVEGGGARYHEIALYKQYSKKAPRISRAEQDAFAWLVGELQRLPKPLAIFESGSDSAQLILRACDAAGLNVPEEVAVLGFGNEPLIAPYATVPLSSVDPDLERQGFEAARLLDRLMDGEPPPREPILIPPKGVVTRQSTDILAVPHVPTARALRFIWEHYNEPIWTANIAAAAGMSKRGLEYAFRKYLHRSVTEEITRRRVGHAKDLLDKTDLKAYEVAEQCGFSGMVYFSKVFKKAIGVGPRQYRRRHPVG